MQLFLASPIAPDLASELEALLVAIRQADDPTLHRAAAADLIIRLTDASLDYFFLRGVDRLGLGLIAKQATSLGLKTASGGIALFVRRLGKTMTADQVRHLADLIEELILEVPEG